MRKSHPNGPRPARPSHAAADSTCHSRWLPYVSTNAFRGPLPCCAPSVSRPCARAADTRARMQKTLTSYSLPDGHVACAGRICEAHWNGCYSQDARQYDSQLIALRPSRCRLSCPRNAHRRPWAVLSATHTAKSRAAKSTAVPTNMYLGCHRLPT